VKGHFLAEFLFKTIFFKHYEVILLSFLKATSEGGNSMPDPIITIDPTRLNDPGYLHDNPDHPRILGNFLHNQLYGATVYGPPLPHKFGKKLKKLRGRQPMPSEEVTHCYQDQPFQLTHSIEVRIDEKGTPYLLVWAKGKQNKNKKNQDSAEKRRTYGIGSYGAIMKAYPLKLEETKEGWDAKLETYENKKKGKEAKVKRASKKVKIGVGFESSLKDMEREVKFSRLISYLDVKGMATRSDGKAVYMDMAKLPKTTLGSLSEKDKNKERPLSTEERFKITLNLLRNLQRIHSLDIVHRDIKPPNILVDLETCNTYIIDFGLAAAVNEEIVPGGTPQYVACELANGGMTARYANDIYSMGVVLGELWGGANTYRLLPALASAQNGKPHFTAALDGQSPFFGGILDLSKKEQEKIGMALWGAMEPNPETRSSLEEGLKVFEELYYQRILDSLQDQANPAIQFLGLLKDESITQEDFDEFVNNLSKKIKDKNHNLDENTLLDFSSFCLKQAISQGTTSAANETVSALPRFFMKRRMVSPDKKLPPKTEKLVDNLVTALLKESNESVISKGILRQTEEIFKEYQDTKNVLANKEKSLEEKQNKVNDFINKINNYEKELTQLSPGRQVFVKACLLVGTLLGAVIGALAGATAGALIGGAGGSVVPVVGNIVGAVVGGNLGALAGALKGAGIGAMIAASVIAFLMPASAGVVSGLLAERGMFSRPQKAVKELKANLEIETKDLSKSETHRFSLPTN
jgi:serine/threonine protein kinase